MCSERMKSRQGTVFWIFGLSGAGKSTVATALVEALRNKQYPVLPLDALRTGLCRGLGFSDQDRTENLRRAAEVARLGADAGLCVVASFITPLETQRRQIGEIIGRDRISLIFADAPLEICRQRDVKGLYARAQAGQVQRMTGMGSTFEAPTNVNLLLPTASISPDASTQLLLNFAMHRLGRME